MKKLFTLISLVLILSSCYKVEIPLFGGTAWEYNGDVVINNVTASKTIFKFINNNVIEIYEDGKLLDETTYEFDLFTRKGYISKYKLTFHRTNEQDKKSDMKVIYNTTDFLFKEIK